ncbi:MAG: hypothetical protein RR147_06930 [Oscillospiraceae bacterium]
MSIKPKDVYRGRRKSRSYVIALISVLLALLILAILVFYGLRSTAVYDKDGNATLILPFTQKAESSPAKE